MATDASSGSGFVRYWASAPSLDLLQLLRTYDTRACKSNRASENEATRGNVETEDVPEKDGMVPETSPGKVDVDENALLASEGAGGGDEQTYHILLLGTGDIHHILTTCAASEEKVHFYILEEREEILARVILLLDVLNDQTLSLPERIETFLDIYGNCFLLAKTATYVEQRVFPHLINFVCCESSHLLDELVDLSHLRHREKGEIQDAMESWRCKVLFDMISLRDQRLRHCYAQRFDYKVNIMDWNYQMNLTHSALLLREDLPIKRNRTEHLPHTRQRRTYNTCLHRCHLWCPIHQQMKRYQNVKVRGFWGDIVNGPFYAYGVTTCESYRERLLRKVNQQHRYNTQEIADFNLSRILYKMEEGKELMLPPPSKKDDMHPLTSPAELLFRQCARSSTCKSSAVESGDASTVEEEKQETGGSTVVEESQKVCSESTNTVEDGESLVNSGTAKNSPLSLTDRINTNDSTDARLGKGEKPGSIDQTAPSSIESARYAEAEQHACRTTEEIPSPENSDCGNPTSSQATSPLQPTPTSLLKGFRSTKITLLKGDAAEVLRRRRYAGLFDMVVIANVATTTFLKACNLLNSPERVQSASQKRNEEISRSPNSDGKSESSVDNEKRETPQDEVAALKEGTAACMNQSGSPHDENNARNPTPYENCLSGCLKSDALVCVETFKYSASLNSTAKIRFRKLLARSAQVLNWNLCNTNSLPPMACEMMDREERDKQENDKEYNQSYSSVAATKQEAAADDYMIFRRVSS